MAVFNAALSNFNEGAAGGAAEHLEDAGDRLSQLFVTPPAPTVARLQLFIKDKKNTFAFLNLKFDVDLGSKPLCVLTTPEQPIAGRPPCSPASDWPGLD